jgi:hypothetical protein
MPSAQHIPGCDGTTAVWQKRRNIEANSCTACDFPTKLQSGCRYVPITLGRRFNSRLKLKQKARNRVFCAAARTLLQQTAYVIILDRPRALALQAEERPSGTYGTSAAKGQAAAPVLDTMSRIDPTRASQRIYLLYPLTALQIQRKRPTSDL